MYHRHKASRGNQEPHVELRVDLDKTIEENYGRKRRGYLRVGVLVLTWEADELQFKATQASISRCILLPKLIPHHLGG